MKTDAPLSTRKMLLLLTATFLFSAFTLTMSYWPFSLDGYQINTPSPRQVISWYTFTYENQQRKKEIQQQIDLSLPLYYHSLENAVEDNHRRLVEWIHAATNPSPQFFEDYLLQKGYIYNEEVKQFILNNRFLLARYANRFFFTLDFLYENYLLVKRIAPQPTNIFYFSSANETKTLRTSQILLTPIDKPFLLSLFRRLYGGQNNPFHEAMAEILVYIVGPVADLDEATRNTIITSLIEQQSVRESIRKGEVLAQQGVPITPTDMQRLQAYRQYTLSLFFSRLPVAILIMFIVFLLFIYRYHKYEDVLQKKPSHFFIGIIFYVLAHGLFWYAHLSQHTFALPPFLNIPFAILTLTLPILLKQHTVSFVLLINFALYFLFYPLADIVSFANLLTLALFALYTASQERKSFKKRYDFFVIGLEITIIQVFFTIFHGWFYSIPLRSADWLFLGIFCLGNSLMSALVAFSILPIFEYVFAIPTYFRLTELASQGTSKLLKELSETAPGTYKHSIKLGEMCEAAAIDIGADALLSRVGALYHDIGKLQTPGFFIENQTDSENPHDEIKPSLSISVIKSHVKNGVEISRQHRLPEEVIAFIEEHHGTSFISYFYNEAVHLYGEETLNPIDYQYAGPKPQSIETAILMLADGVEATIRAYALKFDGRLNPHTMEDILDDIIEQRLKSGQLDECPITLQQIQKIRNAFLKNLLSEYHKRVDYNNRR